MSYFQDIIILRNAKNIGDKVYNYYICIVGQNTRVINCLKGSHNVKKTKVLIISRIITANDMPNKAIEIYKPFQTSMQVPLKICSKCYRKFKGVFPISAYE